MMNQIPPREVSNANRQESYFSCRTEVLNPKKWVRQLLPSLLTLTLLVGEPNLSFAAPFCECAVYVPNVFSPDGAGAPDNETFRPFLPTECSVAEYDLKVFDRWGKLIFQSTNPEQGWDGTFNGERLTANVYVYLIRINLAEAPEGKPMILTGDVSLIRKA